MALTLPDAEDIREWSSVDFAAQGYPAPTPPDDDPLQRIVDAAIAYIAKVTGRQPLTSVPDEDVILAEDAVRMRTEQLVMQSRAETVESSTDDQVRSFSAGSYSETRFDRKKGTERVLNTWPALEEILWALMTEDAKEQWIADLGGEPAPAFEIAEIEFGDRGLT
jgi:hypothetical protein